MGVELMTMILPTAAEISQRAYGYASPLDAFINTFGKRKTEVDKLKEQGGLIQQAINRYNQMNPTEEQYADWKKTAVAPAIDYTNLPSSQQKYADILTAMQNIISAKKNYGSDTVNNINVDTERGILKNYGMDPSQYGMGQGNTLEQSESAYQKANRMFTQQLQDMLMRKQFAAQRGAGGTPFQIAPQQGSYR